jgi:predicted amidohydrolase YtcJ
MSKIFAAKAIVTMNPAQPRATHVAVRDGRILAVGRKDNIADWQAHFGITEIDESFKDKIILPGFIEGHSHMFEGQMWNYIYVGYYDRMGPDGKIWPGLKTIDDVTARLRKMLEAREDRSAPLVAWGFDPIFFANNRLTIAELDQVSSETPILVLHASLHIVNVNSAILKSAAIDPDSNSEFVRRDAEGQITGEFLGQVGLFMAMRASDIDILAAASDDSVLENFAAVAQRSGVTTATDLANGLSDDALATMKRITARDDFPLRLVVAYSGNASSAEDGLKRLAEVQDQQTDKLRMNIVKLVADGSIQGFSARLRWPGYHNGAPNGLWYIEPDRLKSLIKSYHAAGAHIHVHTNGDETIGMALDAFEEALNAHYRADHRHTLQHCQMADRADFKRMAAMGIGVNLFSNHIYYWGDAHIAQTMGRDRANRLDDAGGALREGVALTIHSDAPVTALGPLFTAWCAVERSTSSGDRLGGDAERLTVEEALHAITLGAAYSLKMDHEIGSVEVGKRADFAVLDTDPLDDPDTNLKDIFVHATVLNGRSYINELPSTS